MKIIITIILSFFCISSFGQQPTKPTWKYTGIVQGGLIAGASDYEYTVQTIQGVKKGPWLVGIGVGIDNYFAPGFPVVAHGQYHYGKRRSKPFAYAQAGPQIPWRKNEWEEKFDDQNRFEFKSGWLAEGGLGYQLPLGKKLNLLTSIGYSFKQVTYDEYQPTWWSGPVIPRPSGPIYTGYHQKLTMNRLVFKVGVQF
jgi:hypothetical protein